MKKNTKFNLIVAEPVGLLRSNFLKEITMNNFKILITTLALFAFVGNQQLIAQSCASGITFDLDENEFPTTCVTSNGAEGSPATATFDHDFATNTAGVYSSGADGTNDVTITMSATCSFPNGTNGTTAVGACVGPDGLNVSQGAGLNAVGSGSSDFAGVTVDDAPCANCWSEICYDFINGFSSTADGFDPDWSSLNGSTEGLEAVFGWVEGIDNTGAPFSPGISSAGLAGYCPAQALTLTASEFLTGTAPGGALPPGVFGADAITGDGVATVCPTEEPGSSSGPNSTVSTGLASGAIAPNWGLNPDDEITRFCIVYIMSNSNADDCDGDGATAVNTSPSGSLSTVDFCVPAPSCEVTATVTNPVVCSGDDLMIDIDATAAFGAAPAAVVLVCGTDILGDASPVVVGTTGTMTLNNFEQFSGLTSNCTLQVVDDPTACPGCVIDTACDPVPVSFTFLTGIDASFTQVCNADGSADITITVAGGGLPAEDGGATMYTLGGTNGDGSQVAAGGTFTFNIADGVWDVVVMDDNGCEALVAGVWIAPAMTLAAATTEFCEIDAACPYGEECLNAGLITGTIEPLLGGFTITYDAGGDGFPQEQSFTIFNSAGAPVGTAPADYNAPVSITGLDPADTYTILFEDSFGDGGLCGAPASTFAVDDFAGGNILPATAFDCGGTAMQCSTLGACFAMGPFDLGSPIASITPIGTIAGPGITDNGDNTADFDKCAAGPGVHTVTFDFVDARGCVLSESLELTCTAAPDAPVVMDIEVCPGEAFTATSDVTANFYDALPTDPSAGILATGTTFTAPAAGTYFAVAVSADGCFSCSTEFTITELPLPVAPVVESVAVCQTNPDMIPMVLAPTCEPCADGSDPLVTVYAADGVTMLATGGPGFIFNPMLDNTVPQVGSFLFSCTCQGCEGPTAEASITVNANPDKDIVDIMHETCAGDEDGSAVFVNTNGGDATDPLTAATPISAVYTGPTSGTAVLTASGSTLAAEATGLAPGIYSVELTDALGCTSGAMEFEIFAAPVFVPTCTVWPEICINDDNGAIEFATEYDIPGGDPRTLTISLEQNGAAIQTDPYTAGTTMTYTGLADGLYTIRVVDNLGCEYTEDKNVMPGFDKLPPVTTSVTICQFDGDESGTVDDLTATTAGDCDGTEEIRWFADAASTTVLGTGPTFNAVTQGGVDPSVPGHAVFWAECGCDRCANAPNSTNPSGCSECVSARVPASFIIGQNPQIDLDLFTNESCPGASDGTVTIDSHDAIDDLFYGIVDQATGAVIATSGPTSGAFTFEGLAPGSYIATFVDAAGVQLMMECNDAAFFTILSAEDGMVDNIETTDLTCNGANDGTITLTASGDAGFVAEFSLNGGAFQTSGVYTDLAAGTYTITVRNQNAIDCTVTLAPITITEPEAIPSGTGIDLTLCSGQDVAPLTAAFPACDEALACTDPCDGCAADQPLITVTFTETITFEFTGADAIIPDLDFFNYTVPAPLETCASNFTDVTMTLDAVTGITAGNFVFGIDDDPSLGNNIGYIIGSDAFVGNDLLTTPLLLAAGPVDGYGPSGLPLVVGNDYIFGLGHIVQDVVGSATFTVSYTYQIPDVTNAPASDSDISWWNSPVFGSDITTFDNDGIADVFDPIAAGLVNPSVPGTYTFYAQNQCSGCVSERTPVTLTILDELAAPEIQGPAFVCPGESATFSITPDGVMYTWTLDGVEVGTGDSVDITFDGTTVSQTLTITGVDTDGCTNTASITVGQEVDNAMFCNPSKNASVGVDCAFEVTPFTMVKNPLYDESSYAVTMITNNGTGDIVWNAETGQGSTSLVLEVDPTAGGDCSQEYTVTVEHVCSGNRCTGSLTLEDKTAPTITCPIDVADQPIAAINRELTADSPTYNRVFGTVANCTLSANDNVAYDSFTFSVTEDGTYTFAADYVGTEATDGGDGYGYIYEGSFDPLDPCSNLIALDDDGNGNLDPLLMTVQLSAGETYILVMADFSNDEFGTFDWTFTSDGEGFIIEPAEIAPFLCTEYDNIFTADETVLDLDTDVLITGNPTVSDNCDNFFVTYSDADNGDDCNLSILRTFTVTDACGNVATCNQIINFTNPDLDDVVFPGSFNAECDGSGVTQVHPDSLGEEYDYPYIGDPITGDLNNGLCNINITWTDQVLEQCGSSLKVLREWTVLDWCAVEAGDENTFVQGAQIIFIEDTTGPAITCTTQQVFAADPFECEAVITIPSISYVDQCSGISATIDNNGFPRDVATGNTSQNGDVDNDRVWFVNGDEAVDLQDFTISVTVDGAPYILFDNNGSTNFNGSQLPTDSNGDRILVDVTNGKPFEAQMGDQIRLEGAGDHEIVYTVTDNCGNVSTCTSIITIEDQTAPNPICDENTVAVLGGDGVATICYETFDDGSFDNCDDVIIRVRRMDADSLTTFSECVDFDCADLSYTNCEIDGVTQVRMRVYQAADADLLTFGETEGLGILYNECMINVEVQDKQAPAIICPPDKFLACMDDYEAIDNVSDDPTVGPEVFKDGVLIGYYNGPIIDNCFNHEITLSETGSVDGCGEGDLYRTYTITDLTTCASHSCIQRINVSKQPDQFFLDGVAPSCDLFENNITSPLIVGGVQGDRDRLNWPSDRNINCSADGGGESTDPDDTGRPTFQGTEDDDCHNLLTGFEDKFHYDDPNNCYRILRTWTVIDWCQYDPNSGSCQGIWAHVQVINVNDNAAPIITCGDDIVVAADSDGCATADGCTGTVTLPIEAVDGCGGEVTFTHEIDAFWDGISFTADFAGDGVVTDGEFPSGLHRVRYTATDACGNTASCMYNFEIVDMKAPTPICVALNSVTMDASGSLQIWASDFESGSSCDNCTLYENLQWRIRKANDPTPLADPLTADDLPTGVTFNCADGEIGGQEVQIYLFDEAGNYDFCLTGINIIPGDEDCITGSEMLNIAGLVETEDTDMVQDVNIDVSGTNSSIFTTGSNGLFNFLNAATPGGNYVVTPEKDIDYLNGVTTFDLVLISQHILGVQTLDSPYKIIAADANKSNTVTTLDLVKLQRLILNIDQDLAPNTSWRFVDMDYTFADPTNPFQSTFPEVISINNMTQDEMNADFVGVKIGDVNGSAVSNLVLGSATRNINGNLTLVADETSAATGEAFTVDFTAENFDNVLGYQFTLDFDPRSMDMVEIIPGALKGLTAENFGLSMLNDGIITTSWHNAEGVSVKSTEVLFSIEFKAISDLKLSDVISISSEITKAEAYNSDADLLNVDLGFGTENGVVTNAVFELLQNSPNPFKGETLISFSLPTATPATLSIMDVSGKLLKTIEGDFVKGYNEVKLNSAQFQGAGVLYYQLDTPTDTATKKMILID